MPIKVLRLGKYLNKSFNLIYKEIIITSFFDKIVYSSANEDPLSEIQGLNLDSNDKVLCITGSGARALDLLSQADCSITAIDFNAKQNHLLELKMAAINHLDYGAMLDFLGVNPCSHRSDLYGRIKDDLSGEAASFWQQHPDLIEAGVLYQGTWEQYMRSIARCLATKKKTIHKLFSCRSIEEQQQIWNKEWKSFYWSMAMYFIGRRFLWKYLMKEPGIDYIPNDFDITDYLSTRFDHIANTQLFYSNPYLNLLFNGKYSEASLPLHLQEQSYHQLKSRLKQISIRQSSLQQIGEIPNQYTAFSVSDFSSYSDPAHYESYWQSILAAACPQAKFVERSFLVKYDLPPLIAQQVNIDHQLSKKLSEQDHSFIYDIRCGTIKKS